MEKPENAAHKRGHVTRGNPRLGDDWVGSGSKVGVEKLPVCVNLREPLDKSA